MSRYDAFSRRWSGVVGISTLGALALMSPLALAAKSDVPPGFGYQTTGGKGGRVIEVSTAAQLEKARLAREKNAPKAIVMGPVPKPEGKPTPPLRKPEEFKAVSGAKKPKK